MKMYQTVNQFKKYININLTQLGTKRRISNEYKGESRNTERIF